MKKFQVFKSDDGTQIRIEDIIEVFYPFGDKSRLVRAVVILTVGGEKKDE